MLEYLGIYNQEHIETHFVRILANNRELAETKFVQHLEKQDIFVFEDDMMIIPLFKIMELETIY